MIFLDTDHLSVLSDRRHALQAAFKARLDGAREAIALPIVVIEEQYRGWLAEIHRTRSPHDQIAPYLRFFKLLDFLRGWQIVCWNEPAADEFVRLRKARVRIGTQDLKIAAMALAGDALLLSANLRDFQHVPGLRVEDWLRH